MTGTILILDLHGYGRAHPKSQEAVFKDLFPQIRDIFERKDFASSILDANTWGDAIIVVLDDARKGAQLALEIRDLLRTKAWTIGELQHLAPRIVLHVADLEHEVPS